MATEIRVPTLGESVTEATIGRWLKKEGDAVAADEPLVELETDKDSVEVPAPAAGVLSQISAKEGDTVAVDALLGIVGAAGEAKKAAKPAAGKPAKSAKTESKAGS
ncbi:MAG: biotin/lipoyl-containing protein, partial [Amphiplicatus sp.]